MAAATTFSYGCRSCSTCHDYDPPVANCDSGACGCQRAGSAFGGAPNYGPAGYAEEEYVVEPPADAPPMETEEDAATQP
jgi:hypothetical protein